MKWRSIIIALVLGMVGCRTVKQEVCQTEISKERSVENESIFVYIHDSVATIIRDTSIVSEVKYRDRLVETVVEKKVVPKWALWITGYGLLGLLLLTVLAAIAATIIRVRRLF